MAVAVIRREGESSEKVIGRWKKKGQKARVIQEVRGKRYFSRDMSMTKKKKVAVVREKYRAARKKNMFYA
ncbi:MAG: hypothetical protein U1C97_02395 [Candidatus Gracilibacteria bacterium]|nr:30S ribosomal protein S21 [bacterium]MDZ4217146.1 hypothetical protein [Candidatus Gracilibacteria bacterium]